MTISRFLVLGTILLAATACDDGSDEGGLTQHLRTPQQSNGTDNGGSAPAQDDTDVQGGTQQGPGNPAADTTPGAPTAAPTTSKDFAIALASTTPIANLGDKVDVDVTITPSGSFTGNVDLSVTGLSDGVTAAPVSASVNGATTAKLTLAAAYTAGVTAKGASVPIMITAKAGTSTATAPANFKVAPKVQINIPVNVAALEKAAGGPLRAEWGSAFGPGGESLKTQAGNGVVITIFNADSAKHIIHGPGGSFPHGDTGNPIQPNAFEMLNGAVRTRTMNVGNSATAYPHGETGGTNASFKVSIAATP